MLERSVGEECCRKVLEKSGREVLEKIRVEKCWRRVLWRSVGEQS